MRRPPAPRRAEPYELRIVGAEPATFADLYHALLALTWPRTLALVAAAYLGLNALFAEAYALVGGIAHARPGMWRDAFFFSVQTLGTIGYGAMYPESDGAHALVVVESTLGLIVTALVTGLLFAKFSRPTARLAFSRYAVLAPMDGVPTLSFRVGNRRANRIVEAQFRVVLTRTERTAEGQLFYRSHDLALVRAHAPSLQRSWTLMHRLDVSSPLHGATPESLRAVEAEIVVTVTGTDDLWMQTVHATHRYFDFDVLWGARMVDVLAEDGDVVTLDLRHFHAVEPTTPTPAFPYPRPTGPPSGR